YLQIALDLGLPGLAAVLVLWGVGLGTALAGARQGRTRERACALLAMACIASLAGLGLHGLIDAAVWNNRAAFVPWVVTGLATALGQSVAGAPSTDHGAGAASLEDGAHDH
ncbi:MAG: hypothetical protein V1772_07210, partial [Chloroflexota bacterium]